MFSPGSLEKSCVRPESCSPGRNASTRFLLGIPPLVDENHQISRIQLAVQKYNNSGPIPLNNKSSFLSPVRHCLLKNSLKSKSYETEEGTTKNEKKSGNSYEGVGTFPTIHLRKSAIRYRPIRKSYDVKVPHPELPVNRYLSHLPELCTDLKSSTRSVLEVLQDLSAKKIHQDDDDGSNKIKSKGLAGDYIMDPNAVYKPLFIQKPKPNSVTTRDIMTQTLSPYRSDTPSPQICNLNSRNDVSDPKAELRKKLAKQNNEISASLSSSILSSFAVKRKIDKVITVKEDDQSPDVSAVKKSRIEHTNQTENGFGKSVNGKNEAKQNRKSKLLEGTSPSHNKDRLTSIFLEMRNTSPKNQIFQNADTPNEVNNGTAPKTPTVNGFAEVEKRHEEPPKEAEEQPKTMFTLPMSKPDSPKPNTFQFELPSSNLNFKPPVNSAEPPKDLTDARQTSTKDTVNDKKDEPKTFAFGSANNFIGFKFGTDASKSPAQQKTDNSVVATTTAPVISPQFTFGVKNSDSVVPVQNAALQTTPVKAFTFGLNTMSETPKIASSPVTVTATVTAPAQTSMFTFGQKPAESTAIQTNTQNVTTTPSTTTVPNTVSSNATGLFSFGQKTEQPITSAPTDPKPQFMFTFGQKSEPPKAQEGEKNLFSFGQKPETTQSPTFGQTTVSFGGSKPFGGFGTPVTTTAATTTTMSATQSTFGVSTAQGPLLATTIQSTPTTTMPLYGAAAGTTAATTTTTTTSITTAGFGGSAMTTPAFGLSTTATPAFGYTPAATTVSTITTLAFGAPITAASTFGTSATPAFKFGAGTTQTTSFGASTATTTLTTQSATGFGLNTSQAPAFASTTAAPVFGGTTQSMPTFGGPSATTFGAAKTSASTFGTTTPMFGSTTSTLTTPSFGAATTQNAFGAATTQTTPSFGAVTTQTTPAFGAATQTTPAFGATSQSTPAFGTSTTPAFGTSTAKSTSFPTTSTVTTPAFAGVISFGASSQPNSIFGTPASTQSGFGTSTNSFGVSGGFGTTSQSNTGFGTTGGTQTTSAFGSQSFGKSTTPNLFGQTQTQTFSSGSSFTPPQNIFGAKPNDKMFGAQNNFQFGSTSTSTGFTTSPPATSSGFTTSPPATSSAPVFSFGGGSATNTFSFSAMSSAGSSNTQTPFAFTPNEPFKFGASTSKENSGFGAGASPNFNFGGQINNAPANPAAFDFRQSQNSAASGFNFSAGSSSSPSVFSFGSAPGSSGSSGRGFNFGSPTPGAPFGQSTPTFGVPGTFNIGTGSSQSRPRAASRLRRRP